VAIRLAAVQAIALRQRCSAFDAIESASAEELDLPLVTADRELVNAWQGGRSVGRVRLLKVARRGVSESRVT
jgi:predicted nucleic acid-binding protein